MAAGISSILDKNEHDRSDILAMLQCSEEEAPLLFRKASAVRDMNIGKSIYLRGLIEYSNVCGKNCLYCGIRRENHKVDRYTLTNDEVIEAAMTGSGSAPSQYRQEKTGQRHSSTTLRILSVPSGSLPVISSASPSRWASRAGRPISAGMRLGPTGTFSALRQPVRLSIAGSTLMTRYTNTTGELSVSG